MKKLFESIQESFINEEVDPSFVNKSNNFDSRDLGKSTSISTSRQTQFLIKDHTGADMMIWGLSYLVNNATGLIKKVEYRYDGSYQWDTTSQKELEYYASKKFVSSLKPLTELDKLKSELTKANASVDIYVEPKKAKELYIVPGMNYSNELFNDIMSVVDKFKNFKVTIAGDTSVDWPQTSTLQGSQRRPR